VNDPVVLLTERTIVCPVMFCELASHIIAVTNQFPSIGPLEAAGSSSFPKHPTNAIAIRTAGIIIRIIFISSLLERLAREASYGLLNF
jgi:hypothetical protein